jgi:hypothetical protein
MWVMTSVETLGYSRPSLRDEEGQFLAALDIPVRLGLANAADADKNVRAPVALLRARQKP